MPIEISSIFNASENCRGIVNGPVERSAIINVSGNCTLVIKGHIKSNVKINVSGNSHLIIDGTLENNIHITVSGNSAIKIQGSIGNNATILILKNSHLRIEKNIGHKACLQIRNNGSASLPAKLPNDISIKTWDNGSYTNKENSWRYSNNKHYLLKKLEEETKRENELKELEKKAESGSIEDQFYLGALYYNGKNEVKPEPAKAIKWFQKVAEQDSKLHASQIGLAQSILGASYIKGCDGLEKNNKKALEFFQKAKNNGRDISDQMLNNLLLNTLNQTQFMEQAERYLNMFTYAKTDNNNKTIEVKETLGEFNGYCHGLTVMLIRAWMIGEQNHYIQRWNKFCNMSPVEIQINASLLKKYYAFHQTLTKEGINFLNKELLNYKNLSTSILDEKNSTGHDPIYNDLHRLIQLAENIKKGTKKSKNPTVLLLNKKDINSLIKNIICKKVLLNKKVLPNKTTLSPILDELNFAFEIKAFIDSVACLQKLLQGRSILEQLSILSPDKGVPLKEVLGFAFTFKQEDNADTKQSDSRELLAILKCTMDNNTFAYLNSYIATENGHAIFLMRQDNKWLLIDSNAKTEGFLLEDADLTSKIAHQLYANVGSKKPQGYLPIRIRAFEKTNPSPLARPNTQQLVKYMCDHRHKDNLELDAGSSEKVSSLDLANFYNYTEITNELAAIKAAQDNKPYSTLEKIGLFLIACLLARGVEGLAGKGGPAPGFIILFAIMKLCFMNNNNQTATIQNPSP